MTEIEITEILKIAENFWPKAAGVELGLLRKIVKPLDLPSAKTILEDARMESNYQTLPLKDIKSRVKKFKPVVLGDMMDCYALNQDTGVSFERVVLAQTYDGAKSEMAKWLSDYNKDPIDYILFVGKENEENFKRQRRLLRHQLFPQEKDKYYQFLAGLKKRGLLKDGAEQAVHDKAALDKAMKTATTKPLEIFKSVPDIEPNNVKVNKQVRELIASENTEHDLIDEQYEMLCGASEELPAPPEDEIDVYFRQREKERNSV